MGVFPMRSALACTGIAVFLWFIGFPVWAALLFPFLAFLKRGGLQYCKLIYRTLPRDLWVLKIVFIYKKAVKHFLKSKKYVSDLFHEQVVKHPNKIAIMYEDQKFTFKQVDEASNRIANMLRSTTNLCRGDVVAVFMENCPEYIFITLALSKIGVTGALINYNLQGDGLVHCIRIAKCRGLIFASSLDSSISEVLPSLKDECEILYYVGEDSSIPEAKSLPTESENSSSSHPPVLAEKDSSDRVCYIYTSGTTGLPKACKIKHSKYYMTSHGTSIFSQVCPDDVAYVTLPLYHSSGGVIAVGQMYVQGCTIVLKKRFSASNFWNDCIQYKCTVFFYIGEVCRYVLAQPKRPADTQHCIRLMIGNGLHPQIWAEFVKRFQIPQVAELYGSTEGNFGMVNSFNRVGACGVGSVLLSFANPFCIVKVDADTGKHVRNSQGFCVEADVDEPGELVGRIRREVHSTHFDGYTDPNSSKKKVMKNVFAAGDEYFLTGDILRKDEDGFLYFCDRTGDTFRWKGENVSTTEVEAVMTSILQLRDVVVYGVEVPNSEGRAGMAAIVGTTDSVDLSRLAQQLFMLLPNYSVPLFIRLLPSLELTGTFKLKKVKLRNEGFDISLPDPLFMLDAPRKCYQPLTETVYQKLQSGTLRV